MPNQNRITVVVDIAAEADKLNKVLEQSKKQLNQISPALNDTQLKNFTSQLDKLQKKTSEIKSNFASGLSSNAAFTKGAKDINKLYTDYSDVINRIKRLGINVDDLFPNTKEVQQKLSLRDAKVEEKGKIVGKKYGKSFGTGYQEELQKAVEQGNAKQVKEIQKKAQNELTKNQRSTISKASAVKQRYGLSDMSVESLNTYRNNIMTQYDSLSKADRKQFLANRGIQSGGRAALEESFSREGSQFQKDKQTLKNYEKNYVDVKQSMASEGKEAVNAANQVQQLTAAITNLTQQLNRLAAPMRGDVKSGLNDISNSEKEVQQSTDEMNQKLNEAGNEFDRNTQKAKKFSQLKSYFAYFFSVGTIINTLSRTIRSAVRDFTDLDKQFNAISIVTGKSMQELWSGFSNLNRIAQQYGATTKDVVSVQKLYYQQGRNAAEVTQLTNETLTFARISGLDYAQATDYMTASINAYKIAAEDANKVTDTFAALSANAAVNSEEMAIAMSKVASLASNAGSSFEDTSAYLSKIIETTRESPETAGTALKTIIARFSEVKDLTQEEAELLDDNFNFNNIDKALRSVGISSKNSTGQMRSFSDILNDLGPIWSDLTINQKRYIATQAAGARQQSRFIALLDDWKRTQELQKVATDSAGTGAKQLALALDSIETKTNQLKASWQSFYSSFINADVIKGIISLANDLLGILNEVAGFAHGVFLPAFIAAIVLIIKTAVSAGKQFAQGFMAGWKLGYEPLEKAETSARAAKLKAEGLKDGAIYGKSFKKGKEISEAGGNITGELADIAKATKTGGAGMKAGNWVGGLVTKLMGFLAPILPYLLGAIAAVAGAVIISKIVNGIIDSTYKKAAEKVAEAENATSEATKRTTELTNNYNEALELQRKGLLRTEEEQEKYQETLSKIKEDYPTLVKAMADGTLELNNQSDAYDKVIERQREIIRNSQEITNKYGEKARAYGYTPTEAGKTAKEDIQNIAANLSETSKEELKDIYGINVNPDKFKIMSEKGFTYESTKGLLNIGNASSFNNITKKYIDYINSTNKNKGTFEEYFSSGQQGEQKQLYTRQASEFMSLVNSFQLQAGYDVIGEQLKSSSPEEIAKANALQWADQYAAEAGTIVNDTLKKGFEKLSEQSDYGEEAIKQFYTTIGESTRTRLEKYLSEYNKSGKVGEDISADLLFSMLGIDPNSDYGKQINEFVNGIYDEFSAERDKILQENIGRLNQATGQGYTEKDIKNLFGNYTIDNLTEFTRKIAEVSTKYGQTAANNFLDNYKTLLDNIGAQNEELAQQINSVDLFDNSSIAQFGAKIAQQFGAASDEYQQYVNFVASGSKTVDRAFRTQEQVFEDAANKIEALQSNMKKLGDAVKGNLDTADVLKLIADSNGALTLKDFTTTSNGFQLSYDKALKARQKMIELKLLEYKIELQLNKIQVEEYKIQLLNSNIFDHNREALESFLLAYKELVANGRALIGTNKEIYESLKGNTELLKMATQTLSITESNIAIEDIESLFSKVTIDVDNTNTSLGRTITRLEKIKELLQGIDAYSDINARLDTLSNSLDNIDFTIEFSTNVDEITKATKDKFNNLNEQINTQLAKSQYAEERANQYRDSLQSNWGGYVSFNSSGDLITNGQQLYEWQKKIADMYGSANEKTREAAEYEEKKYDQLLEQIDAYREELGIMRDSSKEAQDLLKQVESLTNELRENVVELEDTFRDLFEKRDEEALDALEQRYDKMKEMDDDYLDSVRDAIDEERRLRDQSQSYEDIAQMERKLALLQMGGGSAVDIQKLQQDIQNARQTMADTEQDNILNAIQKENESRAAAMDEEVEYRRAVLEQKKEDQRLYNEEIKLLLEQDKQTIINTWKALDSEYAAASTTNKNLMESNMDELVTKGISSSKSLVDDGIKNIEDAYISVKNVGIEGVKTAMNEYANNVSNNSNGIVPKIDAIKQAYTKAAVEARNLLDIQQQLNGQYTSSQTQGSVNTSNINISNGNIEDGDKNRRTVNIKKTSNEYAIVSQNGKSYALGADGVYYNLASKGLSYNPETREITITDETQVQTGDYETIIETNLRHNTNLRNENGKILWNRAYFNDDKYEIDGYKQNLVNGMRLYRTKVVDSENSFIKGKIYWINQTDLNQLMDNKDDSTQIWRNYRLKQYATGGLVNYTGPAWVDGTKSKPEAFLSANDTQLIAQLRDVLRAGISPAALSATSIQKTGDTYYEIHINVDELGDGYSVDDLIDEMEERILQATGNNNIIKITR